MRKLSIVSNFHRRRMKRCALMLCYGNIFPEHDQLEINSTQKKKFRPVIPKRCLQINRMKSFTFIFAHHLDTSNVLYRASNYTLRRLKTQMRTKKADIKSQQQQQIFGMVLSESEISYNFFSSLVRLSSSLPSICPD